MYPSASKNEPSVYTGFLWAVDGPAIKFSKNKAKFRPAHEIFDRHELNDWRVWDVLLSTAR